MAEQISKIQNFFADKPVRKGYVFGSFARGEANNNSDLDLLIDWDYSKGIGLNVVSFYDELKREMKMKIDFVSSKWVSPLIINYIEKDKLLVYEK